MTAETLQTTTDKFWSEKKDENIIEHPSHYTSGKIEVINFIDDQKLSYCLGNVIKYVSRAGKKQHYENETKIQAKLEDLKKAFWYLKHEIELTEGEING